MALCNAISQGNGSVFGLAASIAFSVDFDHPQPGRFFEVYPRDARCVVAQQTTVAAVQRPVSFPQIDQSVVGFDLVDVVDLDWVIPMHEFPDDSRCHIDATIDTPSPVPDQRDCSKGFLPGVLAVPACTDLFRSPFGVAGEHVWGAWEPVEQSGVGVVAQAGGEKGLVRERAFGHQGLRLVPLYNSGVPLLMSRSLVWV